MAKKFELKQKEVELKLLAEENDIMTVDLTEMDVDRRVWTEKSRKMILERYA
jgi:hypothetical protein